MVKYLNLLSFYLTKRMQTRNLNDSEARNGECRGEWSQAMGRHGVGTRSARGREHKHRAVGFTNIVTSHPRIIQIDTTLLYYKVYIKVGKYEM